MIQSIAALGALGLGWPRAAAATMQLSSERFEPYVNHVFTFYDSRTGGRARATLLAVKRVPSGPKLDQFSLEFRGRSGVTLGEGRYLVVGGPARRAELFLTPTRGRDGARHYRADFSLLV
ncbi:MAG TPA: hypothetical protein VGJ39_10880 [Vicinamibacterales bacterium]